MADRLRGPWVLRLLGVGALAGGSVMTDLASDLARMADAVERLADTLERSLHKDREPLTWTVPEAAEQMGVGPELIRRGVATGQIPSISLGNRTLIPRAALRNRVNGSTQEAS